MITHAGKFRVTNKQTYIEAKRNLNVNSIQISSEFHSNKNNGENMVIIGENLSNFNDM